jgi:hypothetical protein
MGLLFLEGFETFGVDGDTGVVLENRLRTKWSAVELYVDAFLSDAAYNGQGLCLDFFFGGSTRFLTIGTAPTAELIVGWAWYSGSALPTTDTIYRALGSGSNMFQVVSHTNGGFRIYDGEGNTETATGLVVPATWYYLELKYKIDDTVGYWEFYIDGTLIDSKVGDTHFVDYALEISGHKFYGASFSDSKVDDIYIYDNTGDVQEPFGPVKVKALLPDGDDLVEWTSTGGNHYDQVNDIPVNTATYVESDVASDDDLFTFADASDVATSPIYGVQLNLYAAVTDVGVFTLEGVAESNATQETANETLIDTEGGQYNFVFETDPDTAGEWTVSQLNAAIFGVRVG